MWNQLFFVLRVGVLTTGVAITGAADAEIHLSVGDQIEQSNNAILMVMAQGPDAVMDFQLAVIIGDGGSDLGGSDVGPVVTGVDFEGTILSAGDRMEQTDSFPLAPLWSVDGVDMNSVDGVVAKLTLDTSDLAVGETFMVRLGDGIVDSFFGNAGVRVATDFDQSFTVTVVPEPASSVLAAGLVWVVSRRRRR